MADIDGTQLRTVAWRATLIAGVFVLWHAVSEALTVGFIVINEMVGDALFLGLHALADGLGVMGGVWLIVLGLRWKSKPDAAIAARQLTIPVVMGVLFLAFKFVTILVVSIGEMGNLHGAPPPPP